MIRILARPAFRSPNGISSSLLLAKAMDERRDVTIKDFNSPLDIIFFRPDIIILHWPDNLLGLRNLYYILNRSALFLVLALSRFLFGAKVVWIAHNALGTHYNKPKQSTVFYKKMLRHLDLIVYPLPSLERITRSTHSGFCNRVSIPFGPYPRLEEDPGITLKLKTEINFDPDTNYIFCYGIIRPYKRLEELINIFESSIELSKYRLIIIGKVQDVEYYRVLQNHAIRSLVIGRYIEDIEFPSIFNIASFCLFNYNRISNSGSVRMALTYNCPVLVNYFEQFDDFNSIYRTNMVVQYQSVSDIPIVLNDTSVQYVKPDWNGSTWNCFVDTFLHHAVEP